MSYLGKTLGRYIFSSSFIILGWWKLIHITNFASQISGQYRDIHSFFEKAYDMQFPGFMSPTHVSDHQLLIGEFLAYFQIIMGGLTAIRVNGCSLALSFYFVILTFLNHNPLQYSTMRDVFENCGEWMLNFGIIGAGFTMWYEVNTTPTKKVAKEPTPMATKGLTDTMRNSTFDLLKQIVPSFIIQQYFLGSNEIFNIGFERQFLDSDLGESEPAGYQAALDEYEKIKKEIEEHREFTNDKRPVQLRSIIKQICKKDLAQATVIMICEQAFVIQTANISSYMIDSIREEYQWLYGVKPICWIFVVISLGILQSWADKAATSRIEHSQDKIKLLLKGLLFKKLQTGSFVFLQYMDSSIISKFIDHDFPAITDFIGMVPTIFTAPITLFLAYSVLYESIEGSAFFGIGCFAIMILLVNWLNKVNINNVSHYVKKNEERSDLLYEILPNMKQVKTSSSEGYIRKILSKIRADETQNLEKVQ